MHIPVIFEDSDILVIDKPSGVVVHPFDFSDEETIIDFLHANYSEMFSIENTITLQDKRTIHLGGIVHKLDRDTSGVMIIAKRQTIFNELREQFTNRRIQKTYAALAEGIVTENIFTIDAPLGRGKKDYKQSTNPINPRGELRAAITDVRVLKRGESMTLVELMPRTGRTHQLRAHMSSIEHPIVGDIAYGSTVSADRIMLHATSLTCMLDRKEMSFDSPTPATFTF